MESTTHLRSSTKELVLLQQIAGDLKIPAEGILNFDEEQVVNVIANTFGDHDYVGNPNSNFYINSIDKIIQLHKEKITLLYEQMLKEKDEMIEILEKLIGINFEYREINQISYFST